MLRDRRRHVAVEANPQLIDTIKDNRDRNSLAFAVEHGVVSNSNDGTFYLAPSISHGSRVDRGLSPIRVPTFSLADLERKYGWSFDAMVCDIEGGESEFFADNPGFSARCKAIVIQFHAKLIGEAACEACRKLLRESGLIQVGVYGTNEAWVRPPHSGTDQ
jgi:FkbM family methyltransferase